MTDFNISIVESEAKIILESLIEQENKMQKICDSSDDEDLIADTGNDLIELRLLLKRLKNEFVSNFGPSVLEFSRELPLSLKPLLSDYPNHIMGECHGTKQDCGEVQGPDNIKRDDQ